MAKIPTPVIKKHRPFSKPEKLVEIYMWIENYINNHRFPPTIQEMVDGGIGSSTSVIRYYFDKMTEEGMIEITPRISRGLVIRNVNEWSKRMVEFAQDVEA